MFSGNSMQSPRVFTVEEVDALIPKLNDLVREQMSQQADIQLLLAELARAAGVMPKNLNLEEGDSADVQRLKHLLTQRFERYHAGWRVVTDLGAVVKDPETGLCDFYGSIGGRLVWLCWRYGEEKLGYYHDLNAGFAGRRPLGPETRQQLLN